MDFMQCINFKSRLDREREMIRRKIRSSSLYRKPSFGKSSGFNIYNANGDISKVSCISKNIKINDYKDEPMRKVKSPLLVGVDDIEDENSNEDRGILCIGNKYLDLSSSLVTTSIVKSLSTSTLNMINHDLGVDKPIGSDFERAISQSHLSPSSPSALCLSARRTPSKESEQEPLMKTKTAKALSVVALSKTEEGVDGDESQDIQSPSFAENPKRKDHNKLIKKSTHHMYAVGIHVGKYSDAQKTEVALDDLTNSIITHQTSNKTQNTPASSSKAKKSGASRKKSSHGGKKSDSSAKSSSPKAAAIRKLAEIT